MKKTLLLFTLFIMCCEPFVTTFPDSSDAVMYEATDKTNLAYSGENIKVITCGVPAPRGRAPLSIGFRLPVSIGYS